MTSRPGIVWRNDEQKKSLGPLFDFFWNTFLGYSEAPASDVAAVVGVFLRHLGVNVTDKTVARAVAASDQYGSVSLSSSKTALSLLGVTARAAKVEHVNAEEIGDLPLPFISCSKNGETFAVLAIDGDHVRIFEQSRGYRRLAREALLSSWTGVILWVDAVDPSTEPEYPRTRLTEVWQQISRPVQLVSIAMILMIGGAVTSGTISASIYATWLALLLSSLISLGASLILVNSYIGDGLLTHRFCHANDSSDCFSVLASEHAKFLGIPYVDIGIVYFAGIVLTLLLAPSPPLLVIVPILSVPLLIGYFLYVQKVIIGRWCSLCLWIQGTMFVQWVAVVLAPLWGERSVGEAMASPSLIDLLPLILWWSVAVFWSLLRPALEAQTEARYLSPQLQNVLFSEGYLAAMLSRSESGEFSPLDTDLLIGEVGEERNELALILSVECPSCGYALGDLMHLIKSDKDRLRFRVRIISADSAEGLSVAQHIMALAYANNPLQALEALHCWFKNYQGMDFKGWERTLQPLDPEILAAGLSDLEHVGSWMKTQPYLATPSFFINGKSVHDQYLGQITLLVRKLLSLSSSRRIGLGLV